MPFRLIIICALLAPVFAAPMAAHAQDAGNGTLYVLRPIIHAEQDKAEFCLEFDHPLDSDHNRAAAAVHLESEGRNIPVAAQNISLVQDQLCLPGLEHQRDYRLTVNGLRGAHGEKLAEAYHLSFTVPDRAPALAFAGDQGNGVIRWRANDPLLRGINVERAHIELYRVDDPGLMAEAWKQRLQTTLAPSESAMFARTNGHLVWQGDLVLGDDANVSDEQKVPLQAAAGALPHGLYLVTASARVTKTKFTGEGLAPMAAAWLLRSDLHIRAIRGGDGYYALAEKADASGVVPDARLTVEDNNQQPLAAAESGKDGVAFLPLPADKLNNAAALFGVAAGGDIDFADLPQPGESYTLTPAPETSLTADQAFYAPGGAAAITLAARDAHGEPLAVKGSQLQLLRPDHSLYASLPVPDTKDGRAQLSFAAPATNGEWPMQWRQGDGRLLAEGRLRVTANPDAPEIELTADRATLAPDGEVNLTIKSTAGGGAPAPYAYMPGHVLVAWRSPDHVFPTDSDYRFGIGDTAVTAATPAAAFITDEDGAAILHLHLTPPGDAAATHAAILLVASDPVAGAADPGPVTLPVKPRDYIIGIRPDAVDGKFAENSLAHFDIIALDGDGKRRDVDGLGYQIYEEGRSFDWYQTEGRWDYKPLERQRRIGGDTFDLKGHAGIDWPVTAGSYRLEITDADGAVRARMRFSAGWGLAQNELAAPAKLALTPDAQPPRPDQKTAIGFRLDRPSLVSVVIADSRIRKLLHQPMPAGDNTIDFTPGPDWDDRIEVRIEAASAAGDTIARQEGRIILPLARKVSAAPPPQPAEPPPARETPPPFAITGAAPVFLKTGDAIKITLTLADNTAPRGVYRYALGAAAGLKITGVARGTLRFAPGQKQDIPLALSATQAGAEELTIDVAGPRNFHARNSWTVNAITDDTVLKAEDEQTLAPQQSWSAGKTAADYIIVAPQPFYDLPQILSADLKAHLFTTGAIARRLDVLRLWRDVILATGLMPEQKFLASQHDMTMRLLARQNADGGFPALPNGESDIVNTAAAVAVLAQSDQPVVKPALDQAAGWLRHRLENDWFDERERPARAAAYAALANAGRLDIASLRYFSDTGAGKDLPPLAAAQLAYAFATINDPDKSGYWLSVMRLPKDGGIPAPLLPLLADNIYFDTHLVMAGLDRLSGAIAAGTQRDPAAATAFLRALWRMQNRAGMWRVSVDNSEQNLKNILVLPRTGTSAAPAIRNPGDAPLYLALARNAQMPGAGGAPIARHVYRLNGGEITAADSLERGQLYLVVLEGGGAGDAANPLGLYDNPAAALRPVSCMLDTPLDASENPGWIKNLDLTYPEACEKTGPALAAILKSGDAKAWRVAYFARAEEDPGVFNLAPAVARFLPDSPETGQERGDQLRVQ